MWFLPQSSWECDILTVNPYGISAVLPVVFQADGDSGAEDNQHQVAQTLGSGHGQVWAHLWREGQPGELHRGAAGNTGVREAGWKKWPAFTSVGHFSFGACLLVQCTCVHFSSWHLIEISVYSLCTLLRFRRASSTSPMFWINEHKSVVPFSFSIFVIRAVNCV